MMLNYFNILLCCIIFFFSLIYGQDISYRPIHYCPKNPSYSANSTYNSNLKALLSSLSSNSLRPNGFYNSTEGKVGSEITYGLFLCWGGVSPNDCQNCVSTAAKEITSEDYCPNEKIAILWADECLVRYSDENLFGRETRYRWSSGQSVSDPQRFVSLLGNVMAEIATMAGNEIDRSGKKFATKEVNFSSLERVYSFAQCVPGLSNSSCETCLRGAINFLPTDGQSGTRILLPSCTVRYETYPFYNVTAFASPPAPTVRGSPPPSSPVKNDKGNKEEQIRDTCME